MVDANAIRRLRITEAGECKPDGGTPLMESVKQITDLEGAREYINYIDCTMMKQKLMLALGEGGQGWSAETADKVEEKYKMWLFLKRKHENEIIPPSKEIDSFWHAHIVDTHAYFRDCLAVFGKYLHHYPYFGMRGQADHEKLVKAFENTKRLYREEYGEELID